MNKNSTENNRKVANLSVSESDFFTTVFLFLAILFFDFGFGFRLDDLCSRSHAR